MNSINSNFNAYANTNLMNSQTNNANPTNPNTNSTINSIQNIKSTTNSNSTKNLNSTNFVKDKSEATSQILGYGVDSEGFFTSDFNEVVGLDKDYKIYAKGVENFVNQQENQAGWFKTHTKIDIAKTLKNVFQIFSQLVPSTPNSYLSKDEIQNLPTAFSLDENLNIQKTYTYDEYQRLSDTEQSRLFKTFDIFSAPSYTSNADNIFKSKLATNIGANAYKNADGSVEKGGVFMAFVGNYIFGVSKRLLAGETNIAGKMTGYDMSISQAKRDELNNFLDANKLRRGLIGVEMNLGRAFDFGEWNHIGNILSFGAYIQEIQQEKLGDELAQTAKALQAEYEGLMDSNISLSEFKEKWLAFKAKNDEFVAKYDEAVSAKRANSTQTAQNANANSNANGIQNTANSNTKSANNTTNSTKQENTEQNTIKKRSPIQVTSKSETYTSSYFAKYKNLLEDTQKMNMFEILFGAKSGISNNTNTNGFLNSTSVFNTNGTDLNTNLMNLNLSQIKPLSKVDIKA